MAKVMPCDFGADICRNSINLAGESRGKCISCRLAPGNELLTRHHWIPVVGSLLRSHPVLERVKASTRMAKSKATQQKKLSRDRSKVKLLHRAVQAERKTEKTLNVRPTKNSGRSNKDGDHDVPELLITLDTKHQSKRDNPTVLLCQLAKVREDSIRAGNRIGGLVLRNKQGVGVVVFHEADFARILGHLTMEK